MTFCSVLFLSLPRSEDWPHHGRTFSIYLYPLSFWLTLPQRVLSTTWYCLSRPCVVFLACVHLALFLALFLSPGNSFVSSWCDRSMLSSSLWHSIIYIATCGDGLTTLRALGFTGPLLTFFVYAPLEIIGILKPNCYVQTRHIPPKLLHGSN